MSTDAKRAGNARYLSKFKTVATRLMPEEYEQVKAAAQNAGESVAGYIVNATRERMERDGFTPPAADDPGDSE